MGEIRGYVGGWERGRGETEGQFKKGVVPKETTDRQGKVGRVMM